MKNQLTYLAIAVVLAAPFATFAAPQASAQTEQTRFLVRLVQATSQEGLVNVNVQIGNVIVNDVIDITRNNIAIPITIPVAANIDVDALVCATVLSSGDQICELVDITRQNAANVVTLDLSQAQ